MGADPPRTPPVHEVRVRQVLSHTSPDACEVRVVSSDAVAFEVPPSSEESRAVDDRPGRRIAERLGGVVTARSEGAEHDVIVYEIPWNTACPG